MRNNTPFKVLIDILFYCNVFVVIGMALSLSMGGMTTKTGSMNMASWNTESWMDVVVSVFIYFLFITGLFYLRKVARNILNNNQFTSTMATNLYRSGMLFTLTGILSLFLSFFLWVSHLLRNELKIELDYEVMVPFFLMIIGAFFIIQSKIILEAKGIKEDNELTI